MVRSSRERTTPAVRSRALWPQPREVREHRFSYPPATELGPDVDVLQVDTRLSQKGREVVEEQREGCRLSPVLPNEDFGHGRLPEEPPQQGVLRHNNLVGEALILGKLLDE